ncbi:MAG: 5-(carboxyamino)imidazole ribonucleotide synthase [Methylococcaceae bacterium]
MNPILPHATLGLLGGGQLGQMFALAAIAMGYRVAVLDPDPDSPAGRLANLHLCAGYDDREALDQLASVSAAITTEFENVPADSLRYLAKTVRVSPSADCVAIAQDRISEKRYLVGQGFPVVPFQVIETEADLLHASTDYLPGIVKLARLGYDGKGQIQVHSADDVRAAFSALGFKPSVLEQRVALKTEVSVVIARTAAGQTACYPVAENLHRDGILDVSIVPARVSAHVSRTALDMATRLAEHMDYIGVLAVEFFVTHDDTLLINEIAPRPHNSGHFTQDACLASQFQQQVRTLCGWTPADTRLLSPVVMANLVGEPWFDGSPHLARLLEQPELKLHLYGKREARSGRKMGHVNILADTTETALQRLSVLRSPA